jgi:hypothetical protein
MPGQGDPADMAGRTVLFMPRQEDRGYVLEVLERLDGGERFVIERATRGLRSNGTALWMAVTLSTRWDEAGRAEERRQAFGLLLAERLRDHDGARHDRTRSPSV